MTHKSRRAAGALILGALLSFMLSGAALASPPWSDAPNQFWVDTYGVTDVQAGTVAGGYADGTFRPYRPVTRAEFAKMAVSGLGIPTQDPLSPTFIDVRPGSMFSIYVEGAYAAGLIQGMDTAAGKVFSPDTDISRQQTNSILGRYLSGQELEATGVISGRPGGEEGAREYPSLEAWYTTEGGWFLPLYADSGHVLAAHAPGTAYLIFREVLKGSHGKLEPGANLSRAQAATMVLRVKGAAFTPTPPTMSYIDPTSGPVAGGNTVIIGGAYFIGATAVMFGNTAASSFTVESFNQIRAVAPAHAAGTVVVRVTTPRGTSPQAPSLDYDYTYTTGLPTVSFLIPYSGTTASGDQVDIRGTDLTDATAVMFGDTAASSFTILDDGAIRAVTPAHAAGTVEVRVTTPNGTSVPNSPYDVYTYTGS